eukprot:4643843-Lingulodinium_polyedra.AAC.1
MSSVAAEAQAAKTALSGLGSRHRVPCSQMESFSRRWAVAVAFAMMSGVAPAGPGKPASEAIISL